VKLEDGEVHGFEALVRWYHPTRGLVTPDNFIRVAEETGLIIPLGGWVLNEACRQLAEWQEQGHPDLMISVNVSSKQLASEGFIDAVSMVLVSHAIPSHSLKLEITESAIMENPEAGAAMLGELRGLGVRVGIDDFGTGYSSLASLHRLPLDVLKVDRSFVMKMEEAEENLAIVRTIVMLAKSLRLAVIAEGIETPGQCHQLADMGCQYGQGYLFARPLSVADADAFLRSSPLDLANLGRETVGQNG
jgi:EAL domain-containing protein (putative c-di-GMP-specific phosphodiesterase class I)